jgi:hypothetical protein
VSRAWLVLALVCGCGQHAVDVGELPARPLGAPPPVDETKLREQARAEADEIFATRCTPCHGPEGWGNGLAAASLNPHPRNFHDARWQASVDDRHIETIIQGGGPSVGKSDLMPSNPDLVDRPLTVAALRAKIRAFGGATAMLAPRAPKAPNAPNAGDPPVGIR